MTTRPLVAMAALVLLIAPATAAEKVENVTYTTWSKCKPGTRQVFRMVESGISGVFSDVTITSTLKEVGADSLVLESEMLIKVNGAEISNPPTKKTISRLVESEPGERIDARTGLPSDATEDGSEKLTLGGVEFDCKRYKVRQAVKLEAGVTFMVGKAWMCDAVPGRMMKMTLRGQVGPLTTDTLMEMTELKMGK